MKYRGIFEYEYPTEHKTPVSIDVHLHGDCVKGKIIEWEYRPLEQNPTTKNDLGVDWESYKDVDGNSLDDLILEVLQNNFDCGNTYGYKVADEIIGLLPSVTPQEPRWIPVTERLPDKDGLYLVSVKNDHLRRYSKTCWYSDKNWFARQDVVAWMPLPKPYEGGQEDDKV